MGKSQPIRNVHIDVTLARQRLAFKLNDIANRFPHINNLVQTIILKMWKDAVLLCAFIVIGLLIILWAQWLGDFKYSPLRFPGGYQGFPS